MSRDTSDSQGPIVSGSGVIAAGLASAGAATITSRFGVAGTLLGAALTTMIITGGAAILKAYLENVTGKVRKAPGFFQARRQRRKARRYAEPATVPDRPDLRNNLIGRMRASLGWFSRLPTGRRRSILIKGLIAAVVAFVIGMAIVYGAERLIGNSLSCGFWSNCPYGAEPGIHPFGYGGTGAGSSVGLGGSNAGIAPGGGPRNVPFGDSSGGQNPFSGGGQQDPSSAEPQDGSTSSSSSAEPQDGSSSASSSSSAEPQDGSTSASSSSSAEPQNGSSAEPSSAPAQ